MRQILSLVLALCVAIAPAFADIKPPKGFDKKVYDGALALYASSRSLDIQDRFICSAQVIKKGSDGYFLLSAGHCTPANPELPQDMTFSVADHLGGDLTQVLLVQSVLDRKTGLDYSEFYMRTNKKYPVIELGDENDAIIGDETIDVNFSLADGKYASKGHISSNVEKNPNSEMKNRFGVDQFDSHGASGSSVVDERTKKVIGIVTSGIDGATVASFIEPISEIKKALGRMTLPRTQIPYAPLPRTIYSQEPDFTPILPSIDLPKFVGEPEKP